MPNPSWICPRCRVRYTEPVERCPQDGRRVVEDLSGQSLADRYVLKELIGIGGMNSSVWRAWQKSTERVVAIKVLPPADPAAAGRFARGARIASNISHPHATIVHDYGQTPDGKLFLVMEMLEGHTLHRVLKQSGNLPLDRAIHITEQVLRALEAAHKQRVVHRDLKPGNLFLVHRNDDEDYVKVLDFGIAKYIAENPEDGSEEPSPDAMDGNEVTQERQVCGTPHYMAPEQVALGKVDDRTDLYALAVVFYRMLTGRLPFEGKSHHDLFRQHLTEAPPTFASVRPDLNLPASLEELVMKALTKDPDGRFQSAREMRAALRVVRRNLGVFSSDEPDSSASWQKSGPPWQSAGATVDALPPPARSRKGALVALLLLAFLALGGLLAWQYWPSPEPTRGIETVADPTPEIHHVGARSEAPDEAPIPSPEVPPPSPAQEAYVTFKLQSDPPGANVRHEGVSLGETPLNVKLPAGKQTIKLTLKGYVSEVIPVQLVKGEPLTLPKVKLERARLDTVASKAEVETQKAPPEIAVEPPTPRPRQEKPRQEKRRRVTRRRLPKSPSSPALAASAEAPTPPKGDPPEPTPAVAPPASKGSSVSVQLLDERESRDFKVGGGAAAGQKPASKANIDLLEVDDGPAQPKKRRPSTQEDEGLLDLPSGQGSSRRKAPSTPVNVELIPE